MSDAIRIAIRYIPRMWKAIYAGAIAVSGAYGALQVDGMTWPEWGYLAGILVAAVLGTWKVTNAKATASTGSNVGT